MLAKHLLITSSCLMDEENHPKKGSIQAISYLVNHNIPFVIVSNQSIYSRLHLRNIYDGVGYRYLQPGHFYSSCNGVIDYLLSKGFNSKYAICIGGEGIREALSIGGFIINYEKAEFVFVGTDRNAAYSDYTEVLRSLMHGARLICLDHHFTDYTKNGPAIGTGAITKMLENASNQRSVCFSLLSEQMIEKAMQYIGGTKEDTLMIGTNTNDELLAAIHFGIETALIKENDEEDLMNLPIKPTYIMNDLTSLID